jgi:hypothetical protein
LAAQNVQVKLGDDAPRKLLQALALHDAGVEIMRENLERRMPGASEEEIDSALAEWLAGSADLAGDSNFVRGTWPRR